MTWRKRIPPRDREKLNLEESQNKSACQKYEILLLPLHAMAENFGLVSKSLRLKLGGKSYFTTEGKVALMFLKMYMGLSCPKLTEQLNGNIHY